jgi:hypothetical protein
VQLYVKAVSTGLNSGITVTVHFIHREFQGQYTYLGCCATNGLNQYTSAGPASFSYDANACPEPSRRGNLIADGTNGYVAEDCKTGWPFRSAILENKSK